jgi:hypothetical protein
MIEGACHIKDAIVHCTQTATTMIFLKIFVSAVLLHYHHNLFAIGFAFSIVFTPQTQEVIDRVNTIYQAQQTFREKLCLIVGGGLFAFYTFPTSRIFATLYCAARWGAWLYQSSLFRHRRG